MPICQAVWAENTAALGPPVRLRQREIHTVFPHFPYFRLGQNLPPNLLAPLCSVALKVPFISKQSTNTQYLENGLPRRSAPRNDTAVTIPSGPNGVMTTASVRNALSAATRRRNNPRSTPISGSCRGLFHGTVGVNHWVTSISLTKTPSLFIF